MLLIEVARCRLLSLGGVTGLGLEVARPRCPSRCEPASGRRCQILPGPARAEHGGMGVVRLPAVVRRAGGTGHGGRYLRCCRGEGRCGQGSELRVTPVLDGTVALVTGASGGIGAASASALAAQGAAVALAARRRDRLERSPPASGTRAALRWCWSAASPASGPRPAALQSPRRLALGRRHRERLEPDHRIASGSPDQPETSHRSRIRRTRGRWSPRPPGRRPGFSSHPDPKIKIHYVIAGCPRLATGQCE